MSQTVDYAGAAHAARYAFTTPRSAILRWLTSCDDRIAPEVSRSLLGELFASPVAVVAGGINGIVLNATALSLQRSRIFILFIVLDLLLVSARIVVGQRAIAAASSGAATPTDLYLVCASSWCALQGAMALVVMQTDIVPLQILAATTIMGLIGPICARNYAAPRYAIFLCCLCDFPFVLGAALSGDRWLLILVLQTPLFLLGILNIIRRFHAMAAIAIQSERASRDHARRDFLTGLHNRLGLREALDRRDLSPSCPYALFFLDLDGFKQTNDNHGHRAGDQILQAVSVRLRSAVRPNDVVARVGGDEFVIIADGLSPTDSALLAGTLVRLITDGPYCLAGLEPLRVGVSIGFACCPDDGSSADDLQLKADLALHEVKIAGKRAYRRFAVSGPFDGMSLHHSGRAFLPFRFSSPAGAPDLGPADPAAHDPCDAANRTQPSR